MTTPKQIAYKLARYTREHPETQFAAFEIPQIPGYRRLSRSNKSIAASLITTAYAVPITIVNPYLAGGLFVDYLVRGRYHPMPKDPQLVGPDTLMALTYPAKSKQNPDSANVQAPSAAVSGPAETSPTSSADSDLREMMASHE